jgi:hypothetical protein
MWNLGFGVAWQTLMLNLDCGCHPFLQLKKKDFGGQHEWLEQDDMWGCLHVGHVVHDHTTNLVRCHVIVIFR